MFRFALPMASAVLIFSQLGCQPQSSPAAERAPAVRSAEETPTPTPASIKSYTEKIEDLVKEAIQGRYRALSTGEEVTSGSAHVNQGYCAKGLKCSGKYLSVSIAFADGTAGECSGVSIADDLVLTNRHCVSQLVSRANESFGGGNLAVGYPQIAKGKYHETLSVHYVANVVMMSPADELNPITSPDWAILKLTDRFGMRAPKGYQRPKINRDGFQNGKTYYVYSKPPYKVSDNQQQIERRACKAIYQTVFAPWFDRPQLPVVLLADCPIGPGNSGSPIYNAEDELVGIIGGQFAPQLLSALSNAAHSTLFLLGDQPFASMGWGMPMACIPDLDNPNAPLPQDCNLGPKGVGAELLLPEFSSLAKSAQAIANESSNFRLKSVRANMAGTGLQSITQALVVHAPECVRASAVIETLSELPFELAIAGSILTPFGELTSKSNVFKLATKFEFDSAAFAREGKAAYQLKVESLNFPIHKGVISHCKADESFQAVSSSRNKF